jgi:hypothetical protein
MKKTILALAILTSLSIVSASAFAATTILPTLPRTAQIRFPGTSEGYSSELVKMKDGNYGIAVEFTYYVDPRDSSVEAVVFAPAMGVIHRVGNDLVWTVNGQDMTIAHTKWWYTTFLLNAGVSIEVNAAQNYGTGSGFTVFDVSAELSVQ